PRVHSRSIERALGVQDWVARVVADSCWDCGHQRRARRRRDDGYSRQAGRLRQTARNGHHRRTVIMNDIRATVIKIIYDVCRPEQPDLSNPDRPLLGAHVDSLDFASILMAIEDKFSFQISEKDMEG